MDLFKISLRVLGMLACMTVVLCSAHAQYRASIQGVVTDSQGAAVSGATVTLKNLETNETQTATTDDSGIYNFGALAASKYSVTVEKGGFKKKVLENVGLLADQANALNISLDLGEITQSVTVSGDSTPLMDTQTASINGVERLLRQPNSAPAVLWAGRFPARAVGSRFIRRWCAGQWRRR